ncbi:MAG: hypothetical protein H7306_16130 [Bacteriovorax sp.]|nr:hypothetical protein [Rhizobacter sp.]
MTTTTFQLKLERGRFAQHAKASLVSLLTMARRLLTTTRPAPSAADAAAREAQAVRNMANTYTRTDPGFAADLFAAAARHDGLNGG